MGILLRQSNNNIIVIQIVTISFGSETKSDPIEGVLFYNKDSPNSAIEWKYLKSKVDHNLLQCCV